METTGHRLIDVLELAWTDGFTTKSDLARSNADVVAMAASDGLITTKVAAGLYDRRWHITPTGLRHLWRLKELP